MPTKPKLDVKLEDLVERDLPIVVSCSLVEGHAWSDARALVRAVRSYGTASAWGALKLYHELLCATSALNEPDRTMAGASGASSRPERVS